MADDPVEQARQRIIRAAFDNLAGKADVHDAIDALIAAVRAEVRWFCPICRSKMTCSHPEKHG